MGGAAKVAKHPVGRWPQEATTDKEKVEAWRSNPDWNLAIATGKESGILVVDIA
jgi:hypothetical protein